jgi:hypothetical protein
MCSGQQSFIDLTIYFYYCLNPIGNLVVNSGNGNSLIMQKIPLMLAVTDMVLARDVFRGDSPAGMPVCGKGTVLTDALIARLEHLDIQSVYVVGHPVWDEGDRSFEDVLRDLDKRFDKVADDPLTAKLYNIYKAYLTKSMGDDGGRKAE